VIWQAIDPDQDRQVGAVEALDLGGDQAAGAPSHSEVARRQVIDGPRSNKAIRDGH
jgi:hypothetical protein